MILLLFVCCDNSFASDGKFTFLQKGSQAPFTGTLFDPSATAKIIADRKFFEEEYKLKLGFELEKQQKQFDFDLSQVKITLDTEGKVFKRLLKLRIGKLNN